MHSRWILQIWNSQCNTPLTIKQYIVTKNILTNGIVFIVNEYVTTVLPSMYVPEIRLYRAWNETKAISYHYNNHYNNLRIPFCQYEQVLSKTFHFIRTKNVNN